MARQFKHNIDTEISITYIITSRKLTLVAALGVTIGIAIFIFMNCMTAGFTRKSNTMIFNNTPHIRVYKDDQISQPLIKTVSSKKLDMISNPKVVPESDRIVDPDKIVALLKAQPDVQIVTPQIAVSVFYNSGLSQINGNASGVDIIEADRMFNIKPTMVEGRMEDLAILPNGILLGVGIAAKMNVKTGDNISITSSRNVNRVMKVAGLFKTNNSITDKTKSYISIHSAQQLMREGASYVTDIDVDVTDFTKAADYSARFSALTGYKAEDWKAANNTLVSAANMRSVLVTAISMSILLVAGFGIYNILNMTISQKINDIAILKAMGFQGSDVIRIFVLQGALIGLMGIIAGLVMAGLLVFFTSKIYVGGDIGYFPIVFDGSIFVRGSLFGLVITLLAGYLPARKAANVDPVSIFRK
ncbi:ABC transporter permease [Mucilaginibacter sp. ZT4R22]|uniref:ABC transporter permease n=1 Tax=Mucilaginibacter pankratovii TaxID=2772110 RepID=A0ABR7WL75_9SPHI|nr:ABC transporter permease [Mucilaginibacter pankratovii]MBD1362931.1 ABC transporter permease [Mucilaginibacter pankratovii]